MQQDPLSFGTGNYAYANNSPANFVDPTGLFNRKWLNRWCRNEVIFHQNGKTDWGTFLKCGTEGIWHGGLDPTRVSNPSWDSTGVSQPGVNTSKPPYDTPSDPNQAADNAIRDATKNYINFFF
jgi:hypothetical protein